MGWLPRRWWAIAVVALPASWVGACSSFDAAPELVPEAGPPDVEANDATVDGERGGAVVVVSGDTEDPHW